MFLIQLVTLLRGGDTLSPRIDVCNKIGWQYVCATILNFLIPGEKLIFVSKVPSDEGCSLRE